jgi:NAD(P)-dependent dehydrogenase (short-subunit alcohol dehydrogenase family)
MTSQYELKGKVAIVTGSGRGIGKGIAVELARAGADVVVCSRTQAEVEATADEIRSLGRKTLAVEWAPYGIRVNAVAPGPIETQGFRDTTPPETLAEITSRIPLSRLGQMVALRQAQGERIL